MNYFVWQVRDFHSIFDRSENITVVIMVLVQIDEVAQALEPFEARIQVRAVTAAIGHR